MKIDKIKSDLAVHAKYLNFLFSTCVLVCQQILFVTEDSYETLCVHHIKEKAG